MITPLESFWYQIGHLKVFIVLGERDPWKKTGPPKAPLGILYCTYMTPPSRAARSPPYTEDAPASSFPATACAADCDPTALLASGRGSTRFLACGRTRACDSTVEPHRLLTEASDLGGWVSIGGRAEHLSAPSGYLVDKGRSHTSKRVHMKFCSNNALESLLTLAARAL